MIGAIVGDIIGSRFERQNYDGLEHAHKSKEFELFTEESTFTDDTVLTCAVAKTILQGYQGISQIHDGVNPFAWWMWDLGKEYVDRGFGGQFTKWLQAPVEEPPPPFNSWGNGSAMRVSPIGWIGGSINYILKRAESSSAVTHNHPEAITGAKAVAHAIWLCRQPGISKKGIKELLSIEYYPELKSMEFDVFRLAYPFTTRCSETVPPALMAFFESTSFEDAIRNAISLGGDSDTLAAITGSVAHAYYGEIPGPILEEALRRLTPDLYRIVQCFCSVFRRGMGLKNETALQLPE